MRTYPIETQKQITNTVPTATGIQGQFDDVPAIFDQENNKLWTWTVDAWSEKEPPHHTSKSGTVTLTPTYQLVGFTIDYYFINKKTIAKVTIGKETMKGTMPNRKGKDGLFVPGAMYD